MVGRSEGLKVGEVFEVVVVGEKLIADQEGFGILFVKGFEEPSIFKSGVRLVIPKVANQILVNKKHGVVDHPRVNGPGVREKIAKSIPANLTKGERKFGRILFDELRDATEEVRMDDVVVIEAVVEALADEIYPEILLSNTEAHWTARIDKLLDPDIL